MKVGHEREDGLASRQQFTGTKMRPRRAGRVSLYS
jgi:hypothetical protein